MQTKYLCVHIRNKGEVGAFNMLNPSRIFLTDHSKAVLHLCFACVFVILSFLFIAAVWPHGRTDLFAI